MPPDSDSLSARYFVGMDVHRDTIVACVYDAELRLPCHRAEFSADDAGKLRRFIDRVRARHGEPRCGYEASSCGYVRYRSWTWTAR